MKIKITVRSNGKAISGTKELPNKDHFEAQLKYPKLVYKDKTKYSRKAKYVKNKGEQDHE